MHVLFTFPLLLAYLYKIQLDRKVLSTMRKINNSKSKLLFSSSATLLLGLFLTNPQLVKADKATTKDSQTQTEEVVNNTNNSVFTTETTTNSATSPTQGGNDNAPDDDIVDGSYQGINLYYNNTSNVLTITGGTQKIEAGTIFSNLILNKNNKDYPLKLAKKSTLLAEYILEQTEPKNFLVVLKMLKKSLE